MKILLTNEWTSSTLQNLIHYFSEYFDGQADGHFHWTGARWFCDHMLPLTQAEQTTLLPEAQALTNLQNGFYDVVIYGDSGSLIFLSSHIRSKRVLIDSLDGGHMPLSYWDNCDVYFKCQLPSGRPIDKKLRPMCLGTPFRPEDYRAVPSSDYDHDVFFVGSAHPQDRAKMVGMVKKCGNINFFGGLFNRIDLNFNCAVPNDLIAQKIGHRDFLRKMGGSKIVLSCVGNGNNCFRQYEAMAMGKFLLAQKTPTYWGPKDPVDAEHCAFFETDMSDLIEKCEYYLSHDEERETIARNGLIFYNENYHPRAIVKHMIESSI